MTATQDSRAKRPTSVYRYYDAQDLLLYVGVTSRGMRRQGEHNATKEWWRYVARQEVEHYPSRGEALDRERHLIRKFRPPFNRALNPDWEDARAAYIAFSSALETTPHARTGRPKSVELDVEHIGERTLVLHSRPSDFLDVNAIDIYDAPNNRFAVDSGGRKGKVREAGVSRGVVALRVEVRDADLVESANLMLRREPRRGMPERVTMKRLLLRFGEAP